MKEIKAQVEKAKEAVQSVVEKAAEVIAPKPKEEKPAEAKPKVVLVIGRRSE